MKGTRVPSRPAPCWKHSGFQSAPQSGIHEASGWLRNWPCLPRSGETFPAPSFACWAGPPSKLQTAVGHFHSPSQVLPLERRAFGHGGGCIFEVKHCTTARNGKILKAHGRQQGSGQAKISEKKRNKAPCSGNPGVGRISHVTHILYSRLPPSSGLEQALPGPQEGPGVEIARGKPHRCIIGFGLPCSCVKWAQRSEPTEDGISYWDTQVLKVPDAGMLDMGPVL